MMHKEEIVERLSCPLSLCLVPVESQLNYVRDCVIKDRELNISKRTLYLAAVSMLKSITAGLFLKMNQLRRITTVRHHVDSVRISIGWGDCGSMRITAAMVPTDKYLNGGGIPVRKDDLLASDAARSCAVSDSQLRILIDNIERISQLNEGSLEYRKVIGFNGLTCYVCSIDLPFLTVGTGPRIVITISM